jgi:hypothetical protein
MCTRTHLNCEQHLALQFHLLCVTIQTLNGQPRGVVRVPTQPQGVLHLHARTAKRAVDGRKVFQTTPVSRARREQTPDTCCERVYAALRCEGATSSTRLHYGEHKLASVRKGVCPHVHDACRSQPPKRGACMLEARPGVAMS